jgi:hypothetical protein
MRLNELVDKKSILVLAIILYVGWNIALYVQQPTINDWDLINDTIELQKDTNYPVFNDWSFGHWLRIKGLETKYRSGGNNLDYNSLQKPFIGLTQSNLDCNLQNKYEHLARNLNLYVCD